MISCVDEQDSILTPANVEEFLLGQLLLVKYGWERIAVKSVMRVGLSLIDVMEVWGRIVKGLCLRIQESLAVLVFEFDHLLSRNYQHYGIKFAAQRRRGESEKATSSLQDTVHHLLDA